MKYLISFRTLKQICVHNNNPHENICFKKLEQFYKNNKRCSAKNCPLIKEEK